MNVQFARDFVEAGGALVEVPFGHPQGVIKRFVERGGRLERIPENVGGLNPSNAQRGALARCNLAYVPQDAVEFVEAGYLTISGARAPAVWRILRRLDAPASAWRLASTMRNVAPVSVRKSLELLQRKSLALTVCDEPRRFVARGAEPSWSDFVGEL